MEQTIISILIQEKKMKIKDFNCISFLYNQTSYNVNFDTEPKKLIIPSKKKSGRREIYEYTQLISEEKAIYISFRHNPELISSNLSSSNTSHFYYNTPYIKEHNF